MQKTFSYMAREIIIHNEKLFKRPLNIEDIIGTENYGYGISDEHLCLDKGKTSGGPLIVFDNDNIGRGIQIVDLTNKKKLHLALSIPATENDIKMLYRIASRIASLWKAKHIFVEEDKVKLQDIDIYIQHDIDISKNLLKDADKVFEGMDGTLFPCAIFPISFSIAQLQNYASNLEGFSTFLHEKQKIDVYYSTPLFVKLENTVCSVYVAIPDAPFILPNEPKMKFKQESEEFICGESYIFIHNLFAGEKFNKMNFNDFMNKIPSGKKSEFDYNHTLIEPLTTEELQTIFKS